MSATRISPNSAAGSHGSADHDINQTKDAMDDTDADDGEDIVVDENPNSPVSNHSRSPSADSLAPTSTTTINENNNNGTRSGRDSVITEPNANSESKRGESILLYLLYILILFSLKRQSRPFLGFYEFLNELSWKH